MTRQTARKAYMNILEISKQEKTALIEKIVGFRAEQKNNWQIADELNKLGYKTPSEKPLDDKTVSAFCCRNGLQLRRYPVRNGHPTKKFGRNKKIYNTERANSGFEKITGENLAKITERANLDNDLLEIISSKLSNETKIKCLIALIK